MLRKDLQALARIRVREARRLLDAGENCGAFYLAGLAIECAIKACIAKRTLRYEFPDKKHAADCFDHDPTKLIRLAGLQALLDAECKSVPQFDANWSVVRDWKVESRYESAITNTRAQEIFTAVAARRYGVLRWLRLHW
jgi:hypothetical protein